MLGRLRQSEAARYAFFILWVSVIGVIEVCCGHGAIGVLSGFFVGTLFGATRPENKGG